MSVRSSLQNPWGRRQVFVHFCEVLFCAVVFNWECENKNGLSFFVVVIFVFVLFFNKGLQHPPCLTPVALSASSSSPFFPVPPTGSHPYQKKTF